MDKTCFDPLDVGVMVAPGAMGLFTKTQVTKEKEREES